MIARLHQGRVGPVPSNFLVGPLTDIYALLAVGTGLKVTKRHTDCISKDPFSCPTTKTFSHPHIRAVLAPSVRGCSKHSG